MSITFNPCNSILQSKQKILGSSCSKVLLFNAHMKHSSQFVSCGVPSTTLLFKMLSSHSSRVSFPFSTVFFVVTVFPLTTFVDVEVDLKFPPPPNPPPPKLWKNEELFDPKGSLPNPLPNPKLELKPKLGKLPKGSLCLNLL